MSARWKDMEENLDDDGWPRGLLLLLPQVMPVMREFVLWATCAIGAF